jgi:hypothetical protein
MENGNSTGLSTKNKPNSNKPSMSSLGGVNKPLSSKSSMKTDDDNKEILISANTPQNVI